MPVTYAPSVLSAKHAVFFFTNCFSLDSVQVIVALFSAVSAFTNIHSFAAPRAHLRCIVFCSTVLLVLFLPGY